LNVNDVFDGDLLTINVYRDSGFGLIIMSFSIVEQGTIMHIYLSFIIVDRIRLQGIQALEPIYQMNTV